MKWAEVIAKPDFQELAPADQAYVRQSWWDHFVGPDLKSNGIPDDEIQTIRQQSLESFDNGQGYLTSFASSVGRGVAGSVSGLVGGAGAILDSPYLTQTADTMDATVNDYLPVNPSMKYTNLAGQAVGQAGSLLGTGGVAGGIGKALGGIRAGTMAAEAAVLGSGGITEARDAAREADQYGMTGPERALKIASGILTGVGTEYLPFGLGTETAAVKRLLGAGEKAVGKRTLGLAGDITTEAAEETIGQIANNAFTQGLAPEGVQTPGLMSNVGEAAFGGAVGGATFGGANLLTRPNVPPTAGAAPAPLPPPAGFQAPPAAGQPPPAAGQPPPAAGIPGRASVMQTPTPVPTPGISDAELAALEAAAPPAAPPLPPPAGFPPAPAEPTPAVPAPVPDDRIAIVAGAIATSPGPDVEAEVIQTAAIAAALHAQQTSQPTPSPLAPLPEPAALPVPVVPGQPPAPEIKPAPVAATPATGSMVRLTLDTGRTTGIVTAINLDGTATVNTAQDGLVTVPAAGLSVFGALPQPSAEQVAAANKKQTSARRFTADPAAYPLVTAIVEAGISPRNPAAQLAAARTNRRESLTPKQQAIQQKAGGYNDVPRISEFEGRPRAQDAIRKMLRNGTSNTPDQALMQAATFAGRDPADFYGTTAWQEIRDELMRLDGDVAATTAANDRMDEMERQAIEFYAAIEDGQFRIDLTSLEPRDVLIIEGTPVKVRQINRDENGNVTSVVLVNGKRFGLQEIDGTTALFVEEFQEDPTDPTPDVQVNQATLPPEPGRGPDLPEPRNLPMVPAQPPAQTPEAGPAAPAPEVTADGQRDMLAGREDEPFNLSAESAAERRAREARELAQANAARARENAAAQRAMDAATPTLLPDELFSQRPAAPRNALTPAAVNARLAARGITGPNVRVVSDAALPWEGRLTADGIIELNAARLPTVADVDRVVDHEAAHLAERDPANSADVAALRDAMPADFLAALEQDLLDRGYGNSALPSEVAANLAERLNNQFQQAPVWTRFLQRIKTWAKQKLGLTLTTRDAQALAARILARGFKAQAAQRGRTAQERNSLPALGNDSLEAKARARSQQALENRRIAGDQFAALKPSIIALGNTNLKQAILTDRLNEIEERLRNGTIARAFFDQVFRMEYTRTPADWSQAEKQAVEAALVPTIESLEFQPATTPASKDWRALQSNRLNGVNAETSLVSYSLPRRNRESERVVRLQQQIDAKYESGKLNGVEDLEAELETLLEQMSTDQQGMDESGENNYDAASPDATSFLIAKWAVWNGMGEEGRLYQDDVRARYQTFGDYVRAATGDTGMVVRDNVTNDQIEAAARDATDNYDRRRAAMRSSLPAKNRGAGPVSRPVDPQEVMARTKAGRTVGTRSPSAAKVAGTGANPELLIDLQSARESPKLYKKNAALLAGYRMVAGTIPGVSDRVLAAQQPLVQMAELLAAKKKEIANIKTALAKEIKSAAKDRGRPLSKDDQKSTAMDKRMRAARGELAKAYRSEVKRGIALTEKLKAKQEQVAAQLDEISQSLTMEQADLIYQNTIKATRDNLAKLMELFPDDLRDIAKLWYDGANIIAQQFAESAGVSLEKASAVLAVFSPQKDWFMNVALAQRTMEIWTNDQNTEFSREMADQYVKRAGEPQRAMNKAGEELWMDKEKTIPKFEGGAVPIMEDGEVVGFVWDSAKKEEFIDDQKKIAEDMVGKTLGKMEQKYQSRFIRMREETKYPRDFPIVSPDGTFGGPKLNENGSPAKLAWGSYVTIDKALSIIKAGQANEHQVISDALGVMHKVRSFYNNIVDPQSRDGHVTMDTHAIAALFWEAMSGNSKAVSQNFGGAGSASSSVLGIKGLYPAFAEAYRTLAAELGLLPRQVQSITWEAIRMLFPAKWKSQKANVASVESVWDDYRHGEITQEQARERIFLLVQGRPIGSPEGVGRPDWAPLIHRVNNTGNAGQAADQGKISGDGRSGDGRPGRIGRPGLSGDAARVVRGPSDRGLTQDGAQYSLPSPPDLPGLFEKWFGNDKKLVSDTKLYEARNAIRAALEVPLFAGIDDNHTPGVPLEESIGSLTPDQRTALHDRIVSDLARMTGTAAEAGAYADELRGYLETVPELAGQRLVSPAALQYTNLVQAAAILSGIHGQTAAFSTILNTDNDQLQFDTGTTALLRSDLGRLLASQAGIGARIAAFARLMTTSNNAGLKRLGLTDETIAMLGNAVATKTLTANEIEALFAESTTSPEGPLIANARAKLQRLVDAAAEAAARRPMTAAEKAARAATRLGKSILSEPVGPLVAKLPIGKIVKAFMAAPAAHRNSAAWRQQQITAWLTENGIDAGLASRLTVSMDDMVASIMANLIYQEQEKYITAKKGVGTQAIANSEFAKKYQGNKDAIRSAIRVGLMTDGTPWQAWFSSVTGIRPLTTAEQSQIAAWETILSGDRYFPSEKGVAAAKLRDLLDSHFGKDVSGWEVLAASYDASALSSGTTMAVQFTGPLGKLASLLVTDMTSMIYQPTSAVDVMDSFLAAAETYAAELPNAFRYDTGGNFAADAAMNMGDVAPLKKDMAKQRAILANPNASMVAKSVAVVRFVRSAQDYLRQAMNAADSAAVAGFQRYFESREVRRIMRANKITKAEVAATMAADGFTTDAVELQADALGYDGTLKKRYVGDALWARWKEIVTAHANTPAEHQARMAALLADTEAEGEFSAFVGTKRDQSTPFDPTDWALGSVQSLGERLFANARQRVQSGEVASGSVQRIITRSLLGFVGIPLNAARASLWYSPFSLLSWANYAAWKKGIGYQQNPYERSLGNAIQVRQRMKETIMGNTLLLIAIAALKGLQEDEDWKINGYGPDPSKFPEEAKAWRRLHVPFTIEKTENGKAFNLPYQRGTLEPLKAPLMMLAGWTDAAMESKMRKEPAPELPNQIWGALRQLGLSSITTGMRNIGGMRDALQRGMDAGTLGSQAGFIASPLVPYSGTERWIRQWGQPEQLEKGFINNTPFATVLQDARPALNLFGQKLRPDPSPTELMSRQLSGLPPGYSRPISPADEKLHGWMQRTGKQPTAYSRLDVEKKILRTVTDDEWYAYSLAAGKVRYDQMMAAIDGTLPIERTVKMPGPQPDRKIKAPMKKGLADIDPEDKEAMKQAGAILEDIGAAAHLAGLEAIGEEPTPKAKGKKPPAPVIY